MIILDTPPQLILPDHYRANRPAIIRPGEVEKVDAFNSPFGVFYPAKKVVTWTHHAVLSGATATYNHSSVALVDPAPDRVVIVGILGASSSRTTSTVTVNGVSLTKRVEVLSTAGSSELTSAIWSGVVPTGTSVTATVVWSGTQANSYIGVWCAAGLPDAVPLGTNSNPTATGLSVTTVYGGFVIGFIGNNQSRTTTWAAPVTERFDASSNSGGEGYTTATSTTVTPTLSGAATKAPFVVASF